MRKTLVIGLVAALSLNACANPKVALPVSPADKEKDCAALFQDLNDTRQMRIDAREDDRAMPRYLLIVNGFVSWYRINKAVTASEERMVELQRIAKAKGCEIHIEPIPADYSDEAIAQQSRNKGLAGK